MAKKIAGIVKLQLSAGAATPAPPVGPALGQYGANIMGFVKEYNAATASQAGAIVPVEITIYADRSFTFVTKTSPASYLIKKAAGIDKGSGVPNKAKVGTLSWDQCIEIGKVKMVDLNANDEVAAAHIIAGTARSMGVKVEGGPPMPKHGKRYRNVQVKVDRTRTYPVDEAAVLVKELATAKFDETIEVHLRLGIDPRKSDQNVRGTVSLPHGTGRTVRVLAFAQGDKAQEAEAAGADVVGAQDVIERIQGGWLEFDAVVATPDMMGAVGSKLGRVLGPRGLLPNPKSGTVGFNIAEIVRALKAGQIEFRSDKTGVVHAPIGKASFDAEKLAENLSAVRHAVEAAKPDAARGTYLRTMYVTSTMGPSVRVVI